MEAQDVIDALESELRALQPENFAWSAKRGCASAAILPIAASTIIAMTGWLLA